MNNKGFAITTIVYSIVLLLSIVMLVALAIVKNGYIDQKDFVTEIKNDLNECLNDGTC